MQQSSNSAWPELRTDRAHAAPSPAAWRETRSRNLAAVKQSDGREGFFSFPGGRMRALSIGCPKVLQNERCAGCNAGSEGLTNRNGSGAPETSLTCSATQRPPFKRPFRPLPYPSLCRHTAPALMQEQQLPVGIGKLLRANRVPFACPPNIQAWPVGPRTPRMPSCRPCTADTAYCPQPRFRSHAFIASSSSLCWASLTGANQTSHLLSSSRLFLKQGSFDHDQTRPDQTTTRSDQSNQPGPADIRLTWARADTPSPTMPVRLQGPSWLHRGIWSLHTQAIRDGPHCLGSHSPFDVLQRRHVPLPELQAHLECSLRR